MSFPRYSEYKDSGVEWLGEVPGGWDFFPVKRGFIRRKELNSGMRCENRLALTMGGVVPRALDDVDGLQASEFETYQIFFENDLAFKLIDLQNIKTSRVGLVPETGIMSPAYIRLEPALARVVPRFAYWYFTDLYNRQVFNQLGGGVRQTLGPEELATLPFPFVAIKEQAAITSFLDNETAKIDALVAEQEKLIALLKEKRQAIVSHAVTKGLNPDVPMKDSGSEWLGEVPAHWECRKLSQLADEIGDGLHGTPAYVDESDYFFINGTNLSDGKIEITEDTRCVSYEECVLQGIRLGERSVLLSINGTIGSIALYSGEQVMLGKSAAYITCSPALDRGYFAYFLTSDGCRNYFFQSLSGTTIHNLSLETIRCTRLPLPSLEEQEAIASLLDREVSKLDTLIEDSRRAIALLKERRSALISAAVTGKIDVRGVSVPAAAAACV